jgi:hypothetical protein
MTLADTRKVDLGYASTSHAAQGATVDRVLVNIDSSRGPQLVNDRMCYVAISRAPCGENLHRRRATHEARLGSHPGEGSGARLGRQALRKAAGEKMPFVTIKMRWRLRTLTAGGTKSTSHSAQGALWGRVSNITQTVPLD